MISENDAIFCEKMLYAFDRKLTSVVYRLMTGNPSDLDSAMNELKLGRWKLKNKNYQKDLKSVTIENVSDKTTLNGEVTIAQSIEGIVIKHSITNRIDNEIIEKGETHKNHYLRFSRIVYSIMMNKLYGIGNDKETYNKYKLK